MNKIQIDELSMENFYDQSDRAIFHWSMNGNVILNGEEVPQNISSKDLKELVGNELEKRLAGSDSLITGGIIEMPIPAQRLCKMLDITRLTLNKWRKNKLITPFSMPNSNKVFYFRSEVIKAMKPIREVA